MRQLVMKISELYMFRNETLKQKWVMVYVFLILFFALGVLPFWAAFDVSYMNS